jgi:hypothetical protein
MEVVLLMILIKITGLKRVYFNRFYLKLNNITNHFVGILSFTDLISFSDL